MSRAPAAPSAGAGRGLSAASRLNLAVFRAVFGAAARLAPPRDRLPALSPSSRVLVFTTAGIGDSLLDSAGIRALAETFPGIRIEAVVHHRRMDIAAHNPFLARLHPLRKGPAAFVVLWWRLRARGRWDAVLLLSCHDPEARCLGYLLAKDATAGFGWRTTMGWLTARNLEGKPLRKAHLAEQAVRLAEEFGAAGGTPRMVYEVAARDREAWQVRRAELGLGEGRPLVFQLGGGGAPYRDWPAGHFAELAATARAEGMGPLVLLGGPDHREKAARVVGMLPPGACVDAVGKLPLPLSAALIEEARCVVSTDTGIMHLAFALETPTVALLHPTPGPSRVGPTWKPHLHRVIALPRPPGYKHPASVSMSAVSPASVFEVLRGLWKGAG